MSVWLCIPSARPPEEAERCLSKWRERGYKIALAVDSAKDAAAKDRMADSIISAPGGYRGYARSVNALVYGIIENKITAHGDEADWIVTGGDDVDPDPNHTADEIAAQLIEHFKGTFGVCQPTGDRFAGGSIDRIAGSPWMGRSFCERVNQGKGPLWAEYLHMFADQELQEVALGLGVFWQRPDLIHLHHHFQRESDALNSRAIQRPTPPHLIEANSSEHWRKYKDLFERRKRAGFPGHQP